MSNATTLAQDLAIKESVYKMVCTWLDEIPAGEQFTPHDLQNYVIRKTGGKRRPHDATITRYIRYYNQVEGGMIKCVDRNRSKYRKETA